MLLIVCEDYIIFKAVPSQDQILSFFPRMFNQGSLMMILYVHLHLDLQMVSRD